MTIANWVFDSMIKLKDAGVDAPRRDALVLLEDTLSKERSWVLTHSDYDLNTKELNKVNKLISSRIKRIPLAYIRGKTWFYGRFFLVTKSTLIPRPESEILIDLLKELPKIDRLIDIGTGCGALAITAKLELTIPEVIATDIDESALSVAKKNNSLHKTTVNFVVGSLLGPIVHDIEKNTTIIANLPYVPTDLKLEPELYQEPQFALFSGTDGLNHYRKFWNEIQQLPIKPKFILCESLDAQHQKQKELARLAGYKHKSSVGLIQIFETTK